MAPDVASPADPLAPFREGVASARLVLPFCGRCGRARWYPTDTCGRCRSATDPAWREVAPRGRVFTWTRVHRSFLPEPVPAVPYVVGLVVPDEVPEVRIAALIDAPGREVSIDMPVRLRLPTGGPAPVFAPEEQA